MAGQVYHCRVIFPDGNTLEDTASIGLTFWATGTGGTLDHNAITTLISDYFNNVGVTRAPCYYLSGAISRAAAGCSIEYYDVTANLNGATLGSPVFTDTWTLGSGESGAPELPSECAVCVGYRAAYGSDPEKGASGAIPSTDQAIDEGAPATHTGIIKPRSRDRGRFYFGPLGAGALKSLTLPGAGWANWVDLTCSSDLNAANQVLMTTQNLAAADQYNMVVWSRRAAAVKPIVYQYVDEGIASQRRRGDTTINQVHSWLAV